MSGSPADSVCNRTPNCHSRATDDLYPLLALNHFGFAVGIAFLIGVIAVAYSSADSALTALTTTVNIDFLTTEKYSEKKK